MMKKKIKRFLQWSFVVSFVLMAVLFVYCGILFREIEPLMAQSLKIQPTIVYSDFFTLNVGDIYSNAFLTERLKELKINYKETNNELEWRATAFNYPNQLVPLDSKIRPNENDQIVVQHADDRVSSIKVNQNSVNSVLLDPIAIAQIAGSSATNEIRNYVKLEDIPTHLLQAIIAIEDQRFLEHIGFDPRSLARAFWINLRSRALSQGGSTITQQLIKNLLGSNRKTLIRKVRELVLAILIEIRYSKDFILEKYLNEVYVGQIGSLEIHGVAEAARIYFNKNLAQLNMSEMALIAGLIRGPAYYSPHKHLARSLERKNTVLKKMGELKLITHKELIHALEEPIQIAAFSVTNNRAPYFVDYVKALIQENLGESLSADEVSTAGLKIFTTLDYILQKKADLAVLESVKSLEERYKIKAPLRIEGLMVVADPATGFIKALNGGRSYSETTFNRVLNMKRQVGSTFKPIVYLTAFEQKTDQKNQPYSGAYMIDDEPWVYEFGRNKTWTPHNYEKGFRGHITLREAFANSLNIPMAKIGMQIGVDSVISTAHKLGIKEPLPAIPSLVLGSVELAPLDLLQAYQTLANRGSRISLTAIRLVNDESGKILYSAEPNVQKVFEQANIDLINDLMKSVVTHGTAKLLGSTYGYKKITRGKTGTTNYYRDAWFAGFSENLVAISWAGFDELKVPNDEDELEASTKTKKNTPKFKAPAQLTGAVAALPMWAKFFISAKPSSIETLDPPLDSSIILKKIDKTTGKLANSRCPQEFVYEELFLPNQAPSEECKNH